MRLIMMGCPIRKPPDQRLFAPPRSFSQLIASFIASMCLGIPRTPLVALPKCFLEDDLATLNHRTGDSIFPISKFSKSINNCGADRDRTCDLLNANQALSQLS